MNKLVVLVLMLSISACTRPENSTRILQEQGYTNIQITGYSWFACSKDDTTSTGFIATNPTGKRVTGTVCSGMIFKNSTIRFE